MLLGLISRCTIFFYFKNNNPLTVCYINLIIAYKDIVFLLTLIYLSIDICG